MKNTPYMRVLLGDVNAKCPNWYKHDKTNFVGIAIENISSQCGLYQVINEPTNILENSSSCIDLIFTSQPNLITESGVHPSLHPNYHRQVIYAKFNLKFYIHLHMNVKSGIKKKWIMILFDDHLKCLIGAEHLKTVI